MEYANIINAKATKSADALVPKMVEKAEVISSLPGFSPKVTSTPLMIMDSAVREQIRMVSTNTSKIPKIPCCTGPSQFAAACAIGAEPRPASLENADLLRPQMTAFLSRMPLPAPATACGLNAPTKILRKHSPIISMLPKMTIKVNRI